VLNALKAGFAACKGDVVVVMMADRSDEPKDVAGMAGLIRGGGGRGGRIAYVRGGRQEGGPLLKRTLSWWPASRCTNPRRSADPRRDNNFRAYSRRVIEQIPIEGEAKLRGGVGTHLKAHWNGWRIAEVPTTWHDRTRANRGSGCSPGCRIICAGI